MREQEAFGGRPLRRGVVDELNRLIPVSRQTHARHRLPVNARRIRARKQVVDRQPILEDGGGHGVVS
jgi:hypothetical protein